MSSAPRLAVALLLLLLTQFGQAHGQQPPSPSAFSPPQAQLARPWALGVHCPLLLSCADSDDTALHILYRLAVSQPAAGTSFGDTAVGGTIGFSVTVARWVETGMTLAGTFDQAQGHVTGPFTLWGRITPPPLSELGSDYRHQGLALAAEVREDIGTPPVDGAGSLFPNVLNATAIAQYRKDRFLLLGLGGVDVAGRSYRGMHLGAGLWATVFRGETVDIQLGGEVYAELPQPGAPQISLGAGVRFWQDHWGIGTTAGYVHHSTDDPLAWSVVIGGGLSFGGHHESTNPAELFAPLHYWMAGFRDPVVDADGWIYSDDHKEKLYFYGFPDPKDPSRILPARDSRGEPLRVGQHVLVDPVTRDIRSDDYVPLGHAAHSCALNPVSPESKTAPFALMAGLHTNYVSCGQIPTLKSLLDGAALALPGLLGRRWGIAAASSGGSRPPPAPMAAGRPRPAPQPGSSARGGQGEAEHAPPPQRPAGGVAEHASPGTAAPAVDTGATMRAMRSNPYKNPVTEPVTVVDPHGNAIRVTVGEKLEGSPDGRFVQVKGPNGRPTGVRLDAGHPPGPKHPDPRGHVPHAHVPGVTNEDGTPWLPVKH